MKRPTKEQVAAAPIKPAPKYYLPTPGEDVGHWNVFPKDGESILNVPFDELPEEIKRYIRKL